MKTTLLQISFFFLVTNLLGQKTDNKVDFGPFLKDFKKSYLYSDTIKLPLLEIGRNYKVKLSDNPIYFDIKKISLRKPDPKKYPLSYTVIYRDRLVSLFEPGIFRCYKIPDLSRDSEFENLLNTKSFSYHWILDGKLVALSDKKCFYFTNENQWKSYSEFIPVINSSKNSEDGYKLKHFEDSTYLVFSSCFGEFGGTIYFYNKKQKKIYFTEATCASTVYKADNKFMVLSELGHGEGSCDLKAITDPSKLSETQLDKVDVPFNGQALGYSDRSNHAKVIFDYYSIQTLSSFNSNGHLLYLLLWGGYGYYHLAELNNNVFEIVNPLFNEENWMHYPVTTDYNGTILINYAHYGTALYREVAYILVRDKEIIKIKWD